LAKIDLCDKLRNADSDPGDEAVAVELLVRRYGSAVLGVCLAHTRSTHDAEDLMQDVFLKAVTKIDTLRDYRRAGAWLMQIARRTCADYYRRRRPTRQLDDNIPARSGADTDNESVSRLYSAISKLPVEYRRVIYLYYLDGHKCAGVAKTLDISEDAVRQRLVRARLMLHGLLEENQS